jgi:hypothetical protein
VVRALKVASEDTMNGFIEKDLKTLSPEPAYKMLIL